MNRYRITYAKGADLEQQSVFADDAASAINSFLTKNPEVKSTDIMSVATKGLQSGDDNNIHGGDTVDDEQTRLQAKSSPDHDQPEPSNTVEDARSDGNGTEAPRAEVWSGTSTETADQRIAFGVTAMFVAILLVAVGIWTSSISNENPNSEPSSPANQETADNKSSKNSQNTYIDDNPMLDGQPTIDELSSIPSCFAIAEKVYLARGVSKEQWSQTEKVYRKNYENLTGLYSPDVTFPSWTFGYQTGVNRVKGIPGSAIDQSSFGKECSNNLNKFREFLNMLGEN